MLLADKKNQGPETKLLPVYSDRNELLSRHWSGGGIDEARVDFAYNQRGERVSVERFADLTGRNRVSRSEMTYDDSGRAGGITHFDATDAIIADYNYTYDLANQLIQETHHGETIDYSYDVVGQLISVDRTVFPDEFYTYDANGNRMSSHLHGSDYATGLNNQLISDREFNYEYDAEGSLIRKTEIATGDVTEYAYDHRNRLVRVTDTTSGGIAISENTYAYDVADRRIFQGVDADGGGPAFSQTTYYTYNGANTWADFDAGTQALARYLYGTDVDEVLARWHRKRSRPALAFSGKSGGQAHFSASYALAEMSVSRPKNEPDPDL